MMLRVGDDGVCSAVNEEDLVYVDKNELEEFIESYSQLKSENEQLKENCKNYEWYKQYKAVLNENEQLKNKIDKLEGMLINNGLM